MTTPAAPVQSAPAGQDTTPKPAAPSDQAKPTTPAAPAAAPDPKPQAPAPAAPAAAAPAAAPKVEAKPGEAPKPEAKPGAPADDKAAAQTPAPEGEPKFELKLPDGSLLDAKADVEEVAAFAKANKLSPEVAQKLLEERSNFVGSFLQVQKDMWAKHSDAQRKVCSEHPQYGREKFAETSEKIKRLLEARAPKLIPLLQGETRYGDDPAVFEFLADLAWNNADDSVTRHASGGEPPRPARLADRLYGKSGFSREVEADMAKRGQQP